MFLKDIRLISGMTLSDILGINHALLLYVDAFELSIMKRKDVQCCVLSSKTILLEG